MLPVMAAMGAMGGGMPGLDALESLTGGSATSSSGDSGMGPIASNWNQAGVNFGTQNNPSNTGGGTDMKPLIIGGAVLVGVALLMRK